MTPIRKIMLVDDEEDIRTIAEIALGAVGGWQVVLAGSGSEALSLAEAERPDLILLDVMMPGTDGPATLVRLRAAEATRHIPVIFMTAKSGAADMARYRDMGAVGIIAKPFDPMTLPDEIRKIVAP